MPNLSSISFQFIAHNSDNIHPNIAAKYMHLQKDQNVKQCFDSKIAYIRCTGPNKQSMADELTDGLPVTYRDSFNPDASQTQTNGYSPQSNSKPTKCFTFNAWARSQKSLRTALTVQALQ